MLCVWRSSRATETLLRHAKLCLGKTRLVPFAGKPHVQSLRFAWLFAATTCGHTYIAMMQENNNSTKDNMSNEQHCCHISSAKGTQGLRKKHNANSMVTLYVGLPKKHSDDEKAAASSKSRVERKPHGRGLGKTKRANPTKEEESLRGKTSCVAPRNKERTVPGARNTRRGLRQFGKASGDSDKHASRAVASSPDPSKDYQVPAAKRGRRGLRQAPEEIHAKMRPLSQTFFGSRSILTDKSSKRGLRRTSDERQSERDSFASSATEAEEEIHVKMEVLDEVCEEEIHVEMEVVAELYDPEEARRNETQTEEEVKQRVLDSVVEATVVSLEEEEGKQTTQPPRSTTLAKTLLAVLAGIVGFALLLALMTPRKEDTSAHDASVVPLFPPSNTVVARVPIPICYERIPLSGASHLCPERQELGSAVTNLVAQSRLLNFPQADLAIVNAGEVKMDIPAGNFTVADAWNVLPYNNTLVLVQIQGKELVTVLERALQKLVDDHSLAESSNETTSGGAYPYGAGIRFEVNMSQAFPNRLSNVQVNPQLAHGSWSPVNLSQQYSVVTNSYLAAGGDGYNEFNRLPEDAIIDTKMHSLVAFLEYCQEIQVLQEPPHEYFSTQQYTNTIYDWKHQDCLCNDTGHHD